MTSLRSNNGGLIDQEEIESDIDTNELCREASFRAHKAEMRDDIKELAGTAAEYLKTGEKDSLDDLVEEYSEHEYLAASAIYVDRNSKE